jgi:glucosamine-6-phosphate deaminase
MEVVICKTKQEVGQRAGRDGAELIRETLRRRGSANLILATGASQFEVLAVLVAAPDLDWSKVTCFHLDEYLGLSESHPASFRHYLKERFARHLPLRAIHFLNGEGDARAECRRVGEIIQRHPIDLALVGVGENGHLAFNDPPADFETEEPYLVVDLDEACRRQQLGEGWFKTLEEVPRRAISMSVRQIMKSAAIICVAPETRKAQVMKRCLEGPVSPMAPSSILQQHNRAFIYLDPDSAALLKNKNLELGG